MRDLIPQRPRGEGCVLAFFAVAITGYTMLVLYVFGQLLIGR